MSNFEDKLGMTFQEAKNYLKENGMWNEHKSKSGYEIVNEVINLKTDNNVFTVDDLTVDVRIKDNQIRAIKEDNGVWRIVERV